MEHSFRHGQLVVVVLRDPRERYWGMLLDLESSGIAHRGLEISQWELALSLIKSGEIDQVSLGTRYFPMHRVESMYLDEAHLGVESMADTFLNRTCIVPSDYLETNSTLHLGAPYAPNS
ncbi:MAG: hypothetical protein FWG12_05375 [Holophagaceae bacterium]|nr:hypothetical protein [Holophagaceae bacterium]